MEARIKDLHENHKHNGKFAKVTKIKGNVYSLLFDDGLRYSMRREDIVLYPLKK